MNSDFIVKVKYCVRNIKSINDDDILELELRMDKLIKGIESTILNDPEIGLRQLRSNFNEIRKQFIYTEENVLRRLSELDKEGKDEYFSDYTNTKEVGGKNEEALSYLLELLLTYFPEVAKTHKSQYQRFLPNKAHLLTEKSPLNKFEKGKETGGIKTQAKPPTSSKALGPPKIYFDSPETMEKLFLALKGFFPGKENNLKKALDGEPIEGKLYFPNRQTSFSEVFSRLKYNDKISNDRTEIRDWICTYFQYRFKKGNIERIQDFNQNSVYDTLTRKSEPTKSSRILQNLDWLPFIHKDTLKENS